MLFDISNGWHDCANAIATVVSTKVFSPTVAVVLAGGMNIAGILKILMSLLVSPLFGGWKITKTLGSKMLKLEPIHGFAAETSSTLIILGASHFGMPVSTTHVISTAIMGVGATKRLSAVRWGIAGKIVMAWVLTLPACIVFAWGIQKVLPAV